MTHSPRSRNALRALTVGAFVLLAGCDIAENTAEKLAEEAKQEIAQAARDVLSETAKDLNQQIDQAQKSTEDWLTPEQQKQQDEEQQEARQDSEEQREA
ncbi:hypothetical protein IB229_01520 [Pseudomonas sp. PDM14]|uniref:hypothetical protein n=1 Tax=Pseudomonas sp. PDM14 TaxID=2769288 RepID=UPI00177CBEEE|nr:hypothetical protein [Pseudomonas sp. PDM14]MBD9481636.1 hypothetical protein [Pseudomonas sp. PDM14]